MFLLLPAPPSLNDYYVVQQRGEFHVKVVSKVGKIYQDTIALLKRKLNIPTFRGDLAITLDCFPYSRNSRDIDNYYKCLLDSMQYAGILHNDNDVKWELGRMQQPFRVDNWYYGNSMIILEIRPLKFRPISLAEKIVQILDDGNEVVGLTSAPQEVIQSIKSEKNKLFR